MTSGWGYQGMGRRESVNASVQAGLFLGGYSYVFTAESNGTYMFVGWGRGGSSAAGNDPQGSGSYGEVSRRMTIGEEVQITVAGHVGAEIIDTTLTFADGNVLTAGGSVSNSGVGGVAVGLWDYSLDGSNAVAAGAFLPGLDGLGDGGGLGGLPNSGISGGSGAPGKLPFHGGAGGRAPSGASNEGAGHTPGGGAPESPFPGNTLMGGDGMVVVLRTGN